MDGPFTARAKTLQINANSTASTSIALPGQGKSLRLVNEGNYIAFFSVGSGAQVATLPSTSVPTVTSTPILPGEDATFSIPADQIYNISVICRAAQTTIVHAQVGEGN